VDTPVVKKDPLLFYPMTYHVGKTNGNINLYFFQIKEDDFKTDFRNPGTASIFEKNNILFYNVTVFE